jgi:3-phytase
MNHMNSRYGLWLLSLSAVGAPALHAADNTPVLVDEVFFTSRHYHENVDSMAAWLGPQGQALLYSTCKGTHNLRIEKAANGALIKRFGGLGGEHGQFNRPNGIAVVDDLLLVVERDNRRVQVLSLPSLRTLTTFGEEELLKPYGLYVQRRSAGDYQVYVTDDFDLPEDPASRTAAFGQRVKVYHLEVEGSAPQTAEGEFEFAFGAAEADGRLWVVESVYGDPHYNRLLVADEETGGGNQSVKVYTLGGEFTGTVLGKGIFRNQPEGIALYDCADGSGYWILTDQGKAENFFHLFDRESLEYLGSFAGPDTLNTDGVWLEQRPVGARYPHGLFFAVHNDGNVAAFDWADVLRALGLDPCR